MIKITKKKITLIILILFFIIVICGVLQSCASVNVYLDGENATISVLTIPFLHDSKSMEIEIGNYILSNNNNQSSNITTLKNGIYDISHKYGFSYSHIVINSNLGENKIPIKYVVCGTSMDPTLENGQIVIAEKTKNISVGDIVVANSTEYGMIVKRVDQINGSSIYLVSDNKNVEYKTINGQLYVSRGITTWIDISHIYGVVKIY